MNHIMCFIHIILFDGSKDGPSRFLQNFYTFKSIYKYKKLASLSAFKGCDTVWRVDERISPPWEHRRALKFFAKMLHFFG